MSSINNKPKQVNFNTIFVSTQIETPKNKHFCEKCNKNFSTITNLKNHIMTIHEHNRPFKCPYPNCEKSYSIQSRLYSHIKIHSAVKPYICKICNKGFNEKGNLKTHQRFHSNLRPFKCNFCDKSYKTNGHLKDHIQIQHMHIRKYSCMYCKKTFGRISTLKSHIRTHTGEKNFKCLIDNCNKYFAEKGNMLIHYQRHLNRLEKNNNFEFKNKNEVVNPITRPSSNLSLFSNNNIINNNLFETFNSNKNENNNNNNNLNVNEISEKTERKESVYLVDSFLENLNKSNNLSYNNSNFLIYDGNFNFNSFSNSNEITNSNIDNDNDSNNNITTNNNNNDNKDISFLDSLPELSMDFENNF